MWDLQNLTFEVKFNFHERKYLRMHEKNIVKWQNY